MSSQQIAATRWTAGILAFACVIAIGKSPASAAGPAAPASADREERVRSDYAKLPVAFVENVGQADPPARYYAQGSRFAFYLTQKEVVIALTKANADSGVALALRFIGGNPRARIEGVDRAPGEVNYLKGTDPAAWRTHVARYEQVAYRDLWPGIDLLLREQSGVLKYEFHVRPGARPSDIRLAYAGATGLSLDASGALTIDTAAGVLRDAAPVAYQEGNRTREPVPSRYVLDATGSRDRFAFATSDNYDRHRELIIDPGIQYTTFLGGGGDEIGAGIVVDSTGNAYVGGTTQSPDFPTTLGAFRRTGSANNSADAFVTKLNASGSALIYSTFIGGSDMEFGRRIAIDAAGNAYLTGQTKSSNFPVTGNAFDRTLNIPPNCPRCVVDNTDGFVTKLNATGSALLYSTYLGGTDYDSPRGIAVDAGGNAYVIGETLSVGLSHDGGRVPQDAQWRLRHLRDQAERGGVGARLLDLPRRHAGRQR